MVPEGRRIVWRDSSGKILAAHDTHFFQPLFAGISDNQVWVSYCSDTKVSDWLTNRTLVPAQKLEKSPDVVVLEYKPHVPRNLAAAFDFLVGREIETLVIHDPYALAEQFNVQKMEEFLSAINTVNKGLIDGKIVIRYRNDGHYSNREQESAFKRRHPQIRLIGRPIGSGDFHDRRLEFRLKSIAVPQGKILKTRGASAGASAPVSIQTIIVDVSGGISRLMDIKSD
jgi:hypothetical protein